jgi:hypothetical protein
MSDLAYDSVGGDSVADVAGGYDFDGAPEGASAEADGATWAGPMPEEWNDLRERYGQLEGYLDGLMEHVAPMLQAQEAARVAEIDAAWETALDPLSPDYDPEIVARYYEALANQQLQPLQQELAELRYERAVEVAENEAASIMEAAGVPGDAMEAVYEDASQRFDSQMVAAFDAALASAGTDRDGLLAASQSPDPAWRQWAAETAQWAVAETAPYRTKEAAAAALRASAQSFHLNPAARYVQGPRPDSLAQAARERSLPPRDPATGRFRSQQPQDVVAAVERPDSLKDVARRFAGSWG